MLRNRSSLAFIASSLPLYAALVLPSFACSSEAASDAASGQLLDLAFRAVSKMPIEIHPKDRARAQAQVVDASLELADRERAARYSDQVANWRRGHCYGKLALFDIEQGNRDVDRLLEAALNIADGVERDQNPQAWRRDRVRSVVAKAYLLLGKEAQANKASAGLELSEIQPVTLGRLAKLPLEQLPAELENLDKVLASDAFEQIRTALSACVSLYRRFVDDVDARTQLAKRVLEGHEQLPASVRLEYLEQLAAAATEAGHAEEGKAMLLRGTAMIEGERWEPQNEVAKRARLASLLVQAERALGQEGAEARAALGACVAAYDQKREQMLNIDRAGALRAIAEAYDSIGDEKRALAVYRRAVEAGLENPNSRPRAQDFAATCCSLAVRGVAVDAKLLARLTTICNELGDPW